MDGYYKKCDYCNGEGQVVEYDMVRDEVITVDCKRCNGTGEVFESEDKDE